MLSVRFLTTALVLALSSAGFSGCFNAEVAFEEQPATTASPSPSPSPITAVDETGKWDAATWDQQKWAP